MRAVTGLTQRFGGNTLIVGSGLSVTGLGTLAMMALTARWLPPGSYQSLVTWWAVATFLGTGFFVFENYTARLVVREVAEGADPSRVIGLMTGRASVSVAALCVFVVAAHSWIATTFFHGNEAATFLLVPFVIAAMLQCVQRGVATGERHFVVNATQFATDGLLRAVLVVVVHVGAHAGVALYAAATCASASASVGVANLVSSTWRARPRLRGREPWRPLGHLLMSLTCVMLINNGAVIWLSGTHSVSALTLGAFAGAMTLSQIPTQLSSAITSPTLSNLSYAVEHGDHEGFAHHRRVVLVVTSAVGVAFIALFAVFGHELLALYLGAKYTLGRGFMVALAASSAMMLLALTEQATLGARHRWNAAAVMWTLGTLTFALTLVAPVSALVRATLATDTSVAIALAGMAVINARLGRASRRGRSLL